MPRPLLVMAALGLNAHLLQGQADLPPHIFAPVQGRNVKITGLVEGAQGGAAPLVGLEQIKLTLRAQQKAVARPGRPLLRFLQQVTAVPLERPAVRVLDAAEKVAHTPFARPPGQQRKGIQVRHQEQIGLGHVRKARNGRGVEGDPALRRMGQLVCHDRDILLHAKDIAKSKADELDVALFKKLHQLCYGMAHKALLGLCGSALQNVERRHEPPGDRSAFAVQ